MSASAKSRPTFSALDPLGIDDLLSDEERGWRDRVADWAARRVAPRVAEDFERGHWPRELAPELGELGVLGMHLEGYGCAGASAVEYGLACQELEAVDTGLRTFVSVQGSLAMTAIHAWGSEEQKQRWLPPMARGEAIGCFGLTEPGAGSDPAGMSTTARRDGGDWVVDGAKRWIGMGSIADVAVVWAMTDDGVRGFLVEPGTPGFSARDIDDKLSMRASIQSDLVFDGCRVPADAMLPDAKGLRGPFTCLDEARFGIIWGVTGAARSCLETALAYAKEREQFGKPLAAFQLTQGKLADMAVELAKDQLLALQIARRLDAGMLLPEQISIGKHSNVSAALRIAREARTILGGEGIRGAHPIMRHMANLESVLTYEGTHEVHALVIGAGLTGVRAFK